MAAANPSSSDRIDTFVVTPVRAENAILTRPATRPPDTVLPYSLRVCVVLLRATSVPSRGWRDRAVMSCSVASI